MNKPQGRHTTQQCSTYDANELDRFLQGTLSSELSQQIELHLDHCSACQTQLDNLSGQPDDWSQFQSALTLPWRSTQTRSSMSVTLQSIKAWLAPTDDPHMLGRLGPYEVQGIVGIGGMGIVFKGWDLSLQRTIAIKMLSPHLAANGVARIRFLREARSAAAIVHENVMPIFSIEDQGTIPFLVMPFSRGQTLQKRIDFGGPLSSQQVVRIAIQVARALAAAHAQGLIHRDVKPANIMLDEGTDRVLLTDFGLARAVDDLSVTHSGMIAGTPLFMSPEQVKSESLSARSDLFSLGSVMYTMCAGQTPFRAESSYAVMRQITDVTPRKIQEINPDIPEWLSRIICRLMAKNPADRFTSADQLAPLLEECLAFLNAPTHHRLPSFLLRSTFLERITVIMSDKRILSLVSFGLLLASVLLPWPIYSLGREMPAFVFAFIAFVLSLVFAIASASEFFSRLVLKFVAGTFALMLIGLVISIPVWYARSRALAEQSMAQEQRAIAEMNMMEAQSARKRLEQNLAVETMSEMFSMIASSPTKTKVQEWIVGKRSSTFADIEVDENRRKEILDLMPDVKAVENIVSILVVPALGNNFLYCFFDADNALVDAKIHSKLIHSLSGSIKDKIRSEAGK